MYSKQNNELSKYTDKNFVDLIKVLPFDRNTLPKFLEDRQNRINQMESVEQITFLISVVYTHWIKITYNDKDRYDRKDCFLNPFFIEIFQNQFKTKFNVKDLEKLIFILCSSGETLKVRAAFSLTLQMLHLIKEADQLIRVMDMWGGYLKEESFILIKYVEEQWAEDANPKLANSKAQNANLFFNIQSSKTDTASNESSAETENATSSEYDSSAHSSSEESGFSCK